MSGAGVAAVDGSRNEGMGNGAAANGCGRGEERNGYSHVAAAGTPSPRGEDGGSKGEVVEVLKKKKIPKVTCEICLEQFSPRIMRYQGGDLWTHRSGKCPELFGSHVLATDDRPISELVQEVSDANTSLDVFTNTRGGDREYSLRALTEERAYALVALHRRLRTINWALRQAPYEYPRPLCELVLAFLSGALRRDITPRASEQDPQVMGADGSPSAPNTGGVPAA